MQDYEAAYLAANKRPVEVIYKGFGWFKLLETKEVFRTKELIAATGVLNARAQREKNGIHETVKH